MAGEQLELDVGEVTHGGACIAHADDGRAVFVRHAIPGERVRAVVTDDRERFLRADAIDVLCASPDRVPPPCPFAGAGKCGGCDWQHVRLDRQRELKATVVREQLRRLAGLDVAVTVEPVPGDVDGLSWRTRVQHVVDAGGVVGFRRHRLHDVQAVDRCLIAHPLVDEVGVARRRWPGYAAVEVVAATVTTDRVVVATPTGRRAAAPPDLDAPASVLQADARGRVTPVRGRPGVRERVGDREFRVSGRGFWQVHPGAAQTLTGAVLAALEPRPDDIALDLYGGVGLFAAALAQVTRSVVLIESSPSAGDDARHNLADLRVDVRVGRVDRVLPAAGLGRADVVVVDPPRSGAGRDVCTAIARLTPRRIAYVACDPAALARDLATFATLGYHLAGLRAFDIFPMTAHVECVATLAPTAAPITA